ncbi:hypothetical protein SDC9_96776 [bioreactor metagenome]|uniref:Uncharacterized protein n=1 Tax=bioreactor metagenome TaxID=1076179 RepID=A0A645AA41_9ZZZZ
MDVRAGICCAGNSVHGQGGPGNIAVQDGGIHPRANNTCHHVGGVGASGRLPRIGLSVNRIDAGQVHIVHGGVVSIADSRGGHGEALNLRVRKNQVLNRGIGRDAEEAHAHGVFSPDGQSGNRLSIAVKGSVESIGSVGLLGILRRCLKRTDGRPCAGQANILCQLIGRSQILRHQGKLPGSLNLIGIVLRTGAAGKGRRVLRCSRQIAFELCPAAALHLAADLGRNGLVCRVGVIQFRRQCRRRQQGQGHRCRQNRRHYFLTFDFHFFLLIKYCHARNMFLLSAIS